jgi:hypothetical protein
MMINQLGPPLKTRHRFVFQRTLSRHYPFVYPAVHDVTVHASLVLFAVGHVCVRQSSIGIDREQFPMFVVVGQLETFALGKYLVMPDCGSIIGLLTQGMGIDPASVCRCPNERDLSKTVI